MHRGTLPPSPTRRRCQSGQGLAEYSVILVGIAVICIGILVLFGGKIAALFGAAHDEVSVLDGGDPIGGGGAGSPAESAGPSGSEAEAPAPGSPGGDEPRSASRRARRSTASTGGGPGERSGESADGAEDPVLRPSARTRRGTYQLGQGEDAVTVVAAGGGSGPSRGTAAYERQKERDSAARVRVEEEQRWQRRRRQQAVAEAEAEKTAKGSTAFLGLVRMLLIGVLVLGLAVVLRSTLGGLSGSKEGG